MPSPALSTAAIRGLAGGTAYVFMELALTFNDERRSAPRHEISLDVTFESEHNFYTGLTQDLSGGGLFIATYALRPVGECIRVRFTLPGSTEILDAITEVRWLRQNNTGAGDPGMGLEFLQMSPRTRQAVKDFIEKRESILYDV
jgi:uncharacterized protein (TIGR02266 family)